MHAIRKSFALLIGSQKQLFVVLGEFFIPCKRDEYYDSTLVLQRTWETRGSSFDQELQILTAERFSISAPLFLKRMMQVFNGVFETIRFSK